MNQVLVRVQGLCYAAQGKQLLGPLDFDVAHGDAVAVMGANGAGKSLTLRLMHGLLAPAEGRVQFDGARQDFIAQKPVLLRQSARANVELALLALLDRHATRASRREHAMAALDRVGLADKAHQPARLLSGGEQQRLALARAVATKPDLLLLDEPTAHLDPAATSAVESIIRDMHRAGCTLIFTTHSLPQAKRFASHIVFLDQGRLAEHTPATQFFDNPTSTAARAWLTAERLLNP